MFVIKQLIVMVLILAVGGTIWYLAIVFKNKGWEGVWQWMIRNGDKAWHYIAFRELTLILLKSPIWLWVSWTILIGLALGKEAYDKWFGKEKKWDWGDLLADALGITMGII
jgi:hypothetical protein